MLHVRIPEECSPKERSITFKIVENSAAGNCLFDALFVFLHKNNRIYKELPLSSMELRLRIVKYVSNNWNEYYDDLKINLANQLPRLSQVSQDDAKKQYVDYMSTPGVYGTYVELCAAKEIFNFIGNIFQEKDNGDYSCISIDSDVISQFKRRNKHNLFLVFTGHYDCGHFRLLELTKSQNIGSNLIGNYYSLPTSRQSSISIINDKCLSAKKRTSSDLDYDFRQCNLCPLDSVKRYKGLRGLGIHRRKVHSEGHSHTQVPRGTAETLIQPGIIDNLDYVNQNGGASYKPEKKLNIESVSDKSTDRSHFRAKCPFCDEKSTKTYQIPSGLKIHCRRMHVNENVDEFLKPLEINCSDNFASTLSHLKQSCRIVKRIPKGARIMVATQYSKSIENCIKQNTFSSWQELLTLPFKLLKVPSDNKNKTKSNGKSIVRLIKDNCLHFSSETNFIENNSTNERHSKTVPNQSKSDQNLAKIIESKLADFDIRGAVNIISSNETVAPINEETYQHLLSKHPSPTQELSLPSAPVNSIKAVQVDSVKVQNGIQSFAAGSSGGIDGLRPQHVKDIISFSSGEAGQKCLTSITELCNLLLRGELNSETCPFFYGSNLCAFLKKDGGIRPIAVGCTLRRLTAKLGCFEMKEELVSYFLPHQVGFGVKQGCEAAVHAIRATVRKSRNSTRIVLKIDFKNAFNNINRDEMLKNIKEHAPELYNLLWQSYSTTSHLFFGDKLIASSMGVQQGDPTGPLSFCLTIHPIISSLSSGFNVWYLDDGTICDNPNVVLKDFEQLIDKAQKIGLEVNPSKCEIFFCNGVVDEEVLSKFQKIAPAFGRSMLANLNCWDLRY